jgi:hypothetical protein
MVLVDTTVSLAFNIIYESLFVFSIRSGLRYGKTAIVQEHESLQPQITKTITFQESIFWDITPCSPLKVNLRFGRK